MRTAWLVESGVGGRATWFAGFGWTDNANIAIQFARRMDAEQFITHVLPFTEHARMDVEATEHGFEEAQ